MTSLTFLTLAYLALPNVIFFFGWLSPGVLFIALLFFILAFYFEWKKFPLHFAAFRPSTTTCRSLIISGTLSMIWVAFSGVGGFGLANSDWIKHFSILRDLVLEKWPVIYPEASAVGIYHHVPLIYYLGYYLPAAMIGKIGGWTAANIFLALWTWFGLVLVYEWLKKFVKARYFPLVIGLFILFSGLDIVGTWLHHLPLKPGRHIEWWTGRFFQYSSMTSQLFWVPQHALAAWLGTALLLDPLMQGRSGSAHPRINYHWGPILCMLWSPFALIGFLPLWLWNAWLNRRTFFQNWTVVALGILTLVIFSSFYLSNNSQFPHHELISNLRQNPQGWRYYFEFIFLEMLVLALTPLLFPDQKPWRHLLWVCMGCLLIIPLYKVGSYNDFAMRASMPLLFCLFLCWVRALPIALQKNKTVFIAVIFIYLIGAVTPINEFIRGSRGLGFHPRQIQYVPTIPSSHPDRTFIVLQYFGDPNSFFFRYLAGR
jgi:hypothetical protein